MALTVPAESTLLTSRPRHSGNCSSSSVRTVSEDTVSWPSCILTRGSLPARILTRNPFSDALRHLTWHTSAQRPCPATPAVPSKEHPGPGGGQVTDVSFGTIGEAVARELPPSSKPAAASPTLITVPPSPSQRGMRRSVVFIEVVGSLVTGVLMTVKAGEREGRAPRLGVRGRSPR